MKTMCRLCGASEELSRSHILPEFIYKPLYDEKHRFSVLTAGLESARYAQRGLYEKLLCRGCEQHVCRYEKYASEVMSGRLGHFYRREGDNIIIEDIDYASFKLFQLSVLWRASVSTLEFFRLVSLGPHEDRLRHMLLADDPGAPDGFGCVLTFARDGGQDASSTLFNPEPMRWAGRRMYRFFFAGALWLYHCDKRSPAPHLRKLFFQRDGVLKGLFGDLAEGQIYGQSAKRVARRWGYA
jgi:hypothetical protein